MTNKMKCTWGDIYYRGLRRGYDHGYAAYLADRYVERKKLEKRDRGVHLEAGPGPPAFTG